MFIKERVGIIIEISGREKKTIGYRRNTSPIRLPQSGMTSYCVTLPRGYVDSDQIKGLWFRIDVTDKKEMKFYLPWSEILEIRDLEGNCFMRNCHLCPECRRLVKIRRGSQYHCTRCDIFFDAREPDPGIERYKGDSEP
ncbi:hypothetical protein ACFL0Z_01020 [Patescibacteria group bacterium]